MNVARPTVIQRAVGTTCIRLTNPHTMARTSRALRRRRWAEVSNQSGR